MWPLLCLHVVQSLCVTEWLCGAWFPDCLHSVPRLSSQHYTPGLSASIPPAQTHVGYDGRGGLQGSRCIFVCDWLGMGKLSLRVVTSSAHTHQGSRSTLLWWCHSSDNVVCLSWCRWVIRAVASCHSLKGISTFPLLWVVYSCVLFFSTGLLMFLFFYRKKTPKFWFHKLDSLYVVDAASILSQPLACCYHLLFLWTEILNFDVIKSSFPHHIWIAFGFL